MNGRTIARNSFLVAVITILAGCATLQGTPAGPGHAIPFGEAFRPPGSIEEVLHPFLGGLDGKSPYDDGLLSDSRGDLFGTTGLGGRFSSSCPSGGCGTIFEMVPSGTKYTEKILYRFTGSPDGAGIFGGNLIADKTGAIYGTTEVGGTENLGTVFELTPQGDGYTESVIYSFAGGSDGEYPQAGLARDAQGNLYGTTQAGGPGDWGTVYELSPSNGSYTEKVLFAFNGSDGANPLSSLVFDRSGAMYGTTAAGGGGGGLCVGAGCGTIFKLVPSHGAYQEIVLHAFQFNDGDDPFNATLTPVGSGTFYGTTAFGGALSGCHKFGCGTVFKISGSGNSYTFKTVHNFLRPLSEGRGPQGTLILRDGYLYGTTLRGGKYSAGVVFRLRLDGAEKVLYTFTNGTDGAHPNGGVFIDKQGRIFGTTTNGGNPDCGFCGVVFEIP